MTKTCPRCDRPYQVRMSESRRRSKDHILPRAWGGKDRIHGDVRNLVTICQECNGWRATCGHCWALAACIDAVVETDSVSRRTILRKWGIKDVNPKPEPIANAVNPERWISPRETKQARLSRNAAAVVLGRAVLWAGEQEFVYPADTAAKRVWNLVTLARAGYTGPIPVDLASAALRGEK